jgi:hypothetical protein
MRSTSAKRQSADWRLVIEALRDWSNQSLVESGFAVMQVPAGQAVVIFKVNR